MDTESAIRLKNAILGVLSDTQSPIFLKTGEKGALEQDSGLIVRSTSKTSDFCAYSGPNVRFTFIVIPSDESHAKEGQL